MKKILFIAFVASITIAKAQVCFTTNYYPAGGGNTTMTCTDFNNDGKLDLAIAHYAGSLYLLFGDGLGGFGPATPIIGDSAISNLRCVTSGDFNKDGKADLAVAGYGTKGSVQVLFGDGTGNFPTTKSFAVGNYPFYICSADFNGDGNPDLATANSGSGNISVLLGDGVGNFSAHNDFSVGSSPVSITSGDFNGDGKVDLAVVNDVSGGPDSLWVLPGDGSGSFGTAISYLAGSGPYSVCSKDFNGDGFMDIAVANENSNDISVFLSKGATGLFYPAVNYPTPGPPMGYPTSVVSADFNGDGIPDLAVGNFGHSISILLGTENGNFGTPLNFSAGSGIWTLISADFNSDGRPDIATADHDDGFTSVLLNKISTNCIGCALNSAVPVPDICMVTTDSVTNYQYNVVKWDKIPYANNNVDSFIVYRKDALSSNYLQIGAVSYNSSSEFVDTCFSIGGPNGGNPQYASWFYKLAIMDTCGNVGAMSPYHQTMFVQENGSNFSWNAYAVEIGQTNPVIGYSFLRDDNNTGNWHVLVNIIGTSTTDPNYASFPNGNWRIDALGFNCTPTVGTDNKSHSNTTKLVVSGVEQLSNLNSKIFLYPNPFSFQTTLHTDMILKKATFTVYNCLGRTVKQIKNVNGQTIVLTRDNLARGVYYFRLTEDNKILAVNKLVITD